MNQRFTKQTAFLGLDVSAGARIEVGPLEVALARRRAEFIPEPIVQCQARTDLPIVLGIERIDFLKLVEDGVGVLLIAGG